MRADMQSAGGDLPAIFTNGGIRISLEPGSTVGDAPPSGAVTVRGPALFGAADTLGVTDVTEHESAYAHCNVPRLGCRQPEGRPDPLLVY